MMNRFESPVSMLKFPAPRMVFRDPLCPGAVNPHAANAAFGSDHRLGPPLPLTAGAFSSLVTGGCARPFGVADPVIFQLVGHLRPLPTLVVRPLLWVQLEVICQPPINASRILFEPP